MLLCQIFAIIVILTLFNRKIWEEIYRKREERWQKTPPLVKKVINTLIILILTYIAIGAYITYQNCPEGETCKFKPLSSMLFGIF